MRKGLSIIFSLLIFAVVTPSAALAAYSTGDPLTDQLLTLAQSKLDAEYKTLISGNAADLTSATVELSGKAAEKKQAIADLQLKRNKILADHGQHYTKAVSTLTTQKNDTIGSTAIITAYEYTRLTLVNDNSKDQIVTEEGRTHELHFIHQDNSWSLTEDKIIDNSEVVAPVGGEAKITAQILSLDTTKKHPEPNRDRSKNKSSSDVTAYTVTHGSFNPNSAVNYANSYWGSDSNSTAGYNTAYRVYYDQNSGNLADCTNFASQAMNWGGWQHIGGWYSDANNWWYSPSSVIAWGNRGESFTWINAHYFYFFAHYSARVTNAAYISDFRPGDVLHIDFGTPDGILDHTEIVTTKDGSGNIYLTSHAVNVHNKSFWDIYAQNPGANYYGSLMYYQY